MWDSYYNLIAIRSCRHQPPIPTGHQLYVVIEAAGTAFEKVERPHHTTYDAKIFGDFKVRIEDRPLIRKLTEDIMERIKGLAGASRKRVGSSTSLR